MILSPDHLLYLSDGTYVWTASRVASAWAVIRGKTQELLVQRNYTELCLLIGLPGAGKSTWLQKNYKPHVLYVDAVFSSRQSRDPFIQLALAANKPVHAVVFTTPYAVCAARNDLREDDRKVPVDKMEKFRDDLTAEPPELGTEFQSMTTVSTS